MTDVIRQGDTAPADQELKARHRAMWAQGNYPAVARELIASLGPVLVRAAGIRSGQRVLDIAAGTGNVAIPAAGTGADVVAADLTPELLETGRGEAEAAGVAVDWRVADAEALPFADAEFDVVVSCLGVMFAPHHQDAAAELLRVCRPGGTIALINWTPQGFIGRMFAAMRPYLPAPPAGVSPPPLWGEDEYLRGLLGDGVRDVAARRDTVRVTRFADGPAFRDYFRSNYGPTITAYRGLSNDPGRSAALDRDLADLAAAHDLGGGVMDWEYLLFTAHRA